MNANGKSMKRWNGRFLPSRESDADRETQVCGFMENFIGNFFS